MSVSDRPPQTVRTESPDRTAKRKERPAHGTRRIASTRIQTLRRRLIIKPASPKPSKDSAPGSGTWVVNEANAS